MIKRELYDPLVLLTHNIHTKVHLYQQFYFFLFSAFKYEIRCYTKRTALNEPVFTGILVHDSFLPQPLQYGSRQLCKVGVPWPNEVFYYGLVAIDEAGNRSPISNIISVYIYEAPTTTTTTTTPSTTILRTNSGNSKFTGGDRAVPLFLDAVSISENGDNKPWSKHVRLYVVIGAICGFLFLLIVGIILALIFRVKQKRTQGMTTYDAENRDSYKAYEPSNTATTSVVPSSKGGDKSLTSWLDSLPR